LHAEQCSYAFLVEVVLDLKDQFNLAYLIMSSFHRFTNRIDSTYGLDLRSLALFRISLAMVIIYDLTDRIVDMSDHYTDQGVLPRSILLDYLSGIWEWSLHLSFGHYFGILGLFLVAYIAAFSFLIGYKTKTAAVLSWVLLVSLQTRNPMVLQGGDELLKMIVLWASFLPTDSFYSVNSVKAIRLRPHFSIASIGLATQLIILYVFAGLFKLAERHWLSGEALFLAFGSVDINGHLSRHLLGSHGLLRLSNHMTLLFEILLPFLLFVPWKNHIWRVILIVSYIGFHISVFLTFNVGIFVTVPVAAWLAFLPPRFWASFLGKKTNSQLVQWSLFLRGLLKISTNTVSPIRLRKATNFFLCAILTIVIWWNITTLPSLTKVFPDILRPVIYGATLQQTFAMFSVTLPRSGWVWIPGVLSTGEYVDLTIEGRKMPLRSELPLIHRGNNPNDRWGKFTECLVANHGSLRLHYGKFLCRKVNSSSEEDVKLDTFKIMFVRYNLKPDGTYFGPIVDELWSHECEPNVSDKWKSKMDCLNGGPPCPKN
jgi:hypothetical protein